MATKEGAFIFPFKLGFLRRVESFPDTTAWTPFEPVNVGITEADGRLRVRSPWFHASDGEFTMGDRAEMMPDGRFLLSVDLGAGTVSSTVWTCDLSAEYVRINAEYRT